jgi:hypothetical protein
MRIGLGEAFDQVDPGHRMLRLTGARGCDRRDHRRYVRLGPQPGPDGTAVADQLRLDDLKWSENVERVEPGLSPPWPWHAGS